LGPKSLGSWQPKFDGAGCSRISATSGGRHDDEQSEQAKKHIKCAQVVKCAQIVPSRAAIANGSKGDGTKCQKMGIASLHPGLFASALRLRYLGKNPQTPQVFLVIGLIIGCGRSRERLGAIGKCAHEFGHIGRQGAGEPQALAGNRVLEAQFRCVQGLSLEPLQHGLGPEAKPACA
jgi:hypothetical protein